jgi:ankyrin repeat protein
MTINQFDAARGGADVIKAFAASGGTFTGAQNKYGMTAAMYAAKSGVHAIMAFASSGGEFNDEQDENGYTSAMFAARNGPHAIKAFADAGGKVTDQKNKYGHTARYYAAAYDADYNAGALKALETGVATQKKADAPQQESGVTIRPAPKTSAPPAPGPS